MAQDQPLRVDRRPYLLRPERPPEGEPRRMFEGETETDLNPAMQERARGAGLVMRRPRWSPSTMLAHEATVYAKERGQDGEFHHAAARAYWETGADLGDIEVIRRLAEESGLDWAQLSPRLESGFYRERVLQDYQDAKRRGVSGTPSYWIGGELLRGDVSLEDLKAAVQKAASS